jgi:hypothetical protein
VGRKTRGVSGCSKRSRIIESGEEVKIPILAAKNAARVGHTHLTFYRRFPGGLNFGYRG